MQEDVVSFLAFQMRRGTESGDNEAAMQKLRQFLELERESKLRGLDSEQDGGRVRRLPGLRAFN
jgi:hypothetical protein